MKQNLLKLSLYACCTVFSLLPDAGRAQCTAVTLPYSENFGSVTIGTACSWTATSVSTGAGWTESSTNYAGGTSPELQAYGNNACAGCVETVSLTLASPLNTTGVTSLQLGFRHKLYVTNQATSGPGSGTLRLQTSADGISWTDRWTYGYTISGTSLTSIASGSITVPAFTPTGNNTYVRFAITGVMFKVWGWQIDDVSAIPLITTGIQESAHGNIINALYPNPSASLIHLKLSDNISANTCRVKMSDMLGKEVLNDTYKENIDISQLKKGLYFLSVYKGEQLIETKKVVKE